MVTSRAAAAPSGQSAQSHRAELGRLATERGLLLIKEGVPPGHGTRLCRLTLHPCLFGGFDVVLEWLRDGTRRRLLRRSVESLHNQNAAEVRLRQLVTERLRRGYVPCRPSAATLRAALRRPERHRKPPGLLGELAREVADMPRCGLDWI